MSHPSIRALPLLGSVKHVRLRKSVGFPAPLAPISATRSPLSTTRSMPRKTLLRSKLFFRPAIASKGVSTLFFHRSTNEICAGSPGGRNSLRPYYHGVTFSLISARNCALSFARRSWYTVFFILPVSYVLSSSSSSCKSACSLFPVLLPCFTGATFCWRCTWTGCFVLVFPAGFLDGNAAWQRMDR